MKSRLTKYFKKKAFKQFILFFMLTFVVLIFAKLSNDYKQNIAIEIKLSNLDDEIVIKNSTVNEVSAYVEAKGFALVPFLFKDKLEVEFDADSDVHTLDHAFIFDVQKQRFLIEKKVGKNYKILSLKPDTLILPYSRMAVKNVPLNLKLDIDYAIGYDLRDNFYLSSDSIKIVGPFDAIDSITHLNTKELKLSNIKSDIEKDIEVDLTGYKDVEVFPKSIELHGMVSRFTEGTFEVPIIITNKPENLKINYFPKTVTVSFYVDLERFKSVSSADFIVECEFPEPSENSTFLIPKIAKAPSFVKRTNIKPKRIDFIKL
jgi:hypothetical protein